MKSNTTTILVAAGALLVGGVATAAFMNNRGKSDDIAPIGESRPALDNSLAEDPNAVAPGKGLEYADVVKVDPVTQKEKVYATVIGSEAVRETTSTSTPHEVCKDVVVQERLPERDGNVGGTVVGAVIGGVLGNQVGGGNGRKVATAAGAVA
ncbi:glycine zipper 2TM domain-containing protein, partial [Stenotrophomonas panacihumi]